MRITLPSKTYLTGEYLPLYNKSALIACTQPLFHAEFKFTSAPSKIFEQFHPNSPEAQWINQHKDFFANVELTFTDPHHGAGGFGASGAQFIALYSIYTIQDTHKYPEALEIRQAYLNCVLSQNKPSGADIIAQSHGGICPFNGENRPESFHSWPFKQLGFSIFRSGTKIDTHSHLENLPNLPINELTTLVSKTKTAMHEGCESRFLNAVQKYADILDSLDLLAKPSREILTMIEPLEGVRFAKGCGALGADVILVFHDEDWPASTRAKIKQLLGKCIATNHDLVDGMHCTQPEQSLLN